MEGLTESEAARRLAEHGFNELPAPGRGALAWKALEVLREPMFALLLKLLYVRRRRYYVEHFVFGLLTHAFSFLLLTVTLLMPDVFDAALLLWTVVYFYVAMKRFYGQGWLKTLAKYAILSAVYGIVFSLAMLGTLLVAVLMA